MTNPVGSGSDGAQCTKARRNQRGATLVEFSISAVILVLVFGAIFDFGLGFHRYSYLEHATNKAARDILADLQTRRDCNMIRTIVRRVRDEDMRLIGAPGYVNWQWWFHVPHDITRRPLASDRYITFTLRSEMPLHCYFICWIIPNVELSATASLMIESEDSVCNNGADP